MSNHAVRRLLDLAQPLVDARDDAKVLDFGNKFEILRELGRGGMGIVYEAAYRGAEHLRAALKVLSQGEAADFEVRQRFADEAHLAATLTHPNVPRIYELHSTYIVMEFIDGKTMAAIDRGDRVRLVRLMRDVCLAVHYAHQQGLVHRDLKPQNLMVGKDDHVYVMDFGLAKRVRGRRSFVEAGRVLGTPVYMAPEQAAGRDDLVDARSDVYSLGATLYQLLSDKPPFLGTSRDEILKQVIAAEPMPLQKVSAGIDDRLAAIVMACLAKEREERPASAYALARRLSDWLARFTVPGR